MKAIAIQERFVSLDERADNIERLTVALLGVSTAEFVAKHDSGAFDKHRMVHDLAALRPFMRGGR